MLRCSACSSAVALDQAFCASCGARLDVEADPTGTAPRGTPPAGRPTPGAASSGPGSGSGLTKSRTTSAVAALAGRFASGVLLGERYRIVGLLGKGGMGEVYRADDLKLAQPVALKFLPEALAADEERLDRFYNEVRVARQIAHPSVCRVYDVAEIEGQHFLSMEFVDGEDLASLLRRIGRLPGDKAVEIARQLCAGVAAAHDKGVLHRDLKPENVMVDGRGKVRITDFGLAGLADAIGTADVRSGTPAYMSPEQLSGREVTVRSDVYALGLVLYELFTGKRAFEGRTFVEMLRKHQDEAPVSPSTVVSDLDPAVEHTILRCLEKDPKKRPPSALAVAAGLPGGDPLAAALAAGETPSPEMVAAAGDEGGLSPLAAAGYVAFAVLGALAVAWLGRGSQLFRVVPFEKSPAVLEDRAKDVVAAFGYPDRPADSASGFAIDGDYFQWLPEHDRSPSRWDRLAVGQPPVVRFWYRQSPRPLVSYATNGRVFSTNPPPLVTGMSGVELDMKGRLVEFYAVPPQREEVAALAKAVDWNLLFEEARFDHTAFREVAPAWNPSFAYDARAAWEGTYPDRPDIPIRVEAAAWRGKPVWFRIVAPWTRPEQMEAFRFTPSQKMANTLAGLLFLTALLASALLARRNLRLGRGDRRGATRIAGFTLAACLVVWVLEADHVAEMDREMGLFTRGLGLALVISATLWLLYLALEPAVRRVWPDTLISWTRLLGGRLRDSLVGAHVLVGVANGVLMSLGLVSFRYVARALGEPFAPAERTLDATLGVGQTIRFLLVRAVVSVGLGMAVLLLCVGLLYLFRRRWLVAAVATTLVSLPEGIGSGVSPLLTLPFQIVIVGIAVWTLLRHGLLAVCIALLVVGVLSNLPITTDLTHWSATPSLVVGLTIVALLAYGVRTGMTTPRP